MKELIRFELGKLLHRPLVFASLAGLAIYTAYMLCLWVIPINTIVREEIDGEIKTYKGMAAVRRNQEIISLYEGPFTTNKIQSIIENYSFSAAAMEKNNMNPDTQIRYAHNYLYDLIKGFFLNPDGTYTGEAVEDVYGELAPDLILGYSEGWSCMLATLPDVFPVWACVLAIILSPVFSEEYSRHTDALVLTGSQGRTKCLAAKIIAAYIISLGGSLVILTVFLLCLFFCYGFTGLDSSIQLSKFMSLQYYTLYLGQAFALVLLLLFSGIIVYTALILLISALSRNSYASMIISATVLLAPLSIPMDSSINDLLYIVCALLPIHQLKIISLFYLPHPLPIALNDVQIMLLSLPVTLAATLIGIPCAKRTFSRHQVR